MVKKILSLLLATSMCISFATTVSAQSTYPVVDESNVIVVFNENETNDLSRMSTNWGPFDLETPLTVRFGNGSPDGYFTAQSGTKATFLVLLESDEEYIDTGYYTSDGKYVHIPWTKVWNGDFAQYRCEWTFDSKTTYQPFLSNNTAGTITINIATLRY